MILDFRTKKSDGRLLIKKCFFGFGLHIDFISAIINREKMFSIIFDFIFIRFWFNYYKK